MADLIVNTTAEFHTTLNSVAKPGDRILLAPGTYDGITSKYKAIDFNPPVVITSQDPNNLAKLGKFRASKWFGLSFENLEWVLLPVGTTGAASFEFIDCGRITIRNNKIHGTLNNDASDDIIGVGTRNTSDLLVEGNDFQQLLRALVVGSGNNIQVINNDMHDLRSDAADFAAVTNVLIEGNHIWNFKPTTTDHPDAIQFWTSGTTTASKNIIIRNNFIEKANGAGTQGIFLRDQLLTLPYENVTIQHNLLYDTGYNAIRVQGGKDFKVIDNDLITIATTDGSKPYDSGILLQRVDGVRSERNRAVGISFAIGGADLTDDSKNITQVDDVITKAMTREEAEAVKAAWLKTFRAPPAPIDPHLAEIEKLKAELDKAVATNAQLVNNLNVVNTELVDVKATLTVTLDKLAELKAQLTTTSASLDKVSTELQAAQTEVSTFKALFDTVVAQRNEALALAQQLITVLTVQDS